MAKNPAQDSAISTLTNQYRSRPLVAIAECERILAKEEPSKFRAAIATMLANLRIAYELGGPSMFAVDDAEFDRYRQDQEFIALLAEFPN